MHSTAELRVSHGMAAPEEELSLDTPNPLPQEQSLSTGPGDITGKPPSPAYVSC